MALQLYTLVGAYVDGALLAEEGTVSIDVDSRAQEVNTVVKGFAGLSPGAAKIMVRGMREGWFTGLDCAGCLPGKGPGVRSQFVRARRIINGTDKADMIAGYALAFQAALKAGGWE